MFEISQSVFPNLATPDLGCFVRRKHDLETRNFNIHEEFTPSVDFAVRHHQAYFRVVCGKSSIFQRATVHISRDINILGFAFPPDWVLGGDFPPRPSDWLRYPTQSNGQEYYFVGQHRNPADAEWQPDTGRGHIYDIYDRGTLTTVRYRATGDGDVYDDLVLQIALVEREAWFESLGVAPGQEEVNRRFESEILPGLRDRYVSGRPDEAD